MAQIVKQTAVCDGYDVQIVVAGQPHVLHFHNRTPSADEIQVVISEFEDRLLQQIAEQRYLEFIPEGDNFNGL